MTAPALPLPAPADEPALFAAPVLVDPVELAALRRKVAAADAFAELLVLRRAQRRDNVPGRELALFRAILEGK